MYGIDRRFGIEIEAFIPRMSLSTPHEGSDRQRLSSAMTKALGWSPSGDGWKIKGDGSIRENDGNSSSSGFEYTSPPLEFTNENLIKVRDFVDCLKDQGALVNKSCGLHLHMDMANETTETVAKFWDRYALLEDEIDKGVASPRKGDRAYFCRSIKTIHSKLEELRGRFIELSKKDLSRTEYLSGILLPKVIKSDKYRKVSPRYFYDPHGSMKTVEVRHHHGSMDGKEVAHWVAFCQSLFETSKKAEEEKDKADIYFGMPDRVAEVWKEKATKYPDLGDGPDRSYMYTYGLNNAEEHHRDAADEFFTLSTEDEVRLERLFGIARAAYRDAGESSRYQERFFNAREEYRSACNSTPGGRRYMRSHRI